MKKKTSKLRLNRETVLRLNSGQLQGIYGACTGSCGCVSEGDCTMHCGDCEETDLCSMTCPQQA